MSATETRPAVQQQGNGHALQIRTDPRANEFKRILDSEGMQRSLASALPKHLSPTRMVRLALGVFQTSPKVLECTPESVLLSIMQAAFLGLEIGSGFGAEGYLVPYKGKCTFMPGYRGLCKLARQSGQIADISAEVVYEADEFSYELGLEQTLKHKRNDHVDNPGELKYAYAVARFRDGEKKFVVMNKREIAKCRSSSQLSSSGPWVDHTAEMWKKTAIRRLCKMLPMSVEAQTAIAREEQFEATGHPVQLADVEIPALSLPAEQPSDQVTEASEDSGAEAAEALLANFQRELSAATSISSSAEVSSAWRQRHPELAEPIGKLTEQRQEEIRASRGAKQNTGAS